MTKNKYYRLDIAQRKNACVDVVKILIDDVILAIKINDQCYQYNACIDHMEKYMSIPQRWHSRNYAFEFVDSIITVIQKEDMCVLQNASCHTLVIDESTYVFTTKMLILSVKFCPQNEIN